MLKITLKIIRYLKLSKEKLQQRFIVFVFFVFLSSVFWMLSTLGEIHEAIVYYPVKYINIPKNFVLIDDLPDKLLLKIKAEGFSIISYKLLIKSPIKIDVNNIQLKQYKKDPLKYYTSTRRIRSVIEQELKSNKKRTEIVEIKPDTLFFKFTETIFKFLPIKPNIIATTDMYEKQYTVNGKIHTEPDSIEVVGPKSILDTVKYIYTTPISFTGLNDSVIKTVQLNKINKVRFTEKNVRLIIPVDKFTESSITAPIHVINTPDSLVLMTFPSSVRIIYTVTFSNFNNVGPEMFNPFVDYNLIESATANKLKVYVSELPEYLQSVRINPSNVEFLIEKK